MLPDPADPVTPAERARLARKGQILYGKYCGTKGRGICAESFALHQLGLGHREAVTDLVDFLDTQVDALRASDPAGLLAMTVALTGRIRDHLDEVDERVRLDLIDRQEFRRAADQEARR